VNKPKVAIIRTAGTNCDFETKKAFELAGAHAERVHINQFINHTRKLPEYEILAVPGGFSYGDDIASGKILANEIKNKLGEQIAKFAMDGKPIIGICNGFQILVKMGLLPDTKLFKQTSTLTFNDSDKFECRWINLKAEKREKGKEKKANCLWTKNLPEIIQLPVAHGEGKFVAGDKKILDELEKSGQVVFRYVSPDGKLTGYPYNPNGATNNIAGICNKEGNVFGLMPHPERFVYKWQHPSRLGADDDFGWGLQIFKNAVEYVK
jgi:phosphoribosylformylglycinamidine synthase